MVKRLFAVGTGVAMLGATAMGAMAVDLGNYPNMFVTNGVFDGFLVVGDTAKPVDNLAMTDIAAAMKVSAGTTTAVSVSGDAWKVGTSSKDYEMANSNATSSSIIGENIRAINTYVGKEELGALADGIWSTNENEYEYSQYLYFDNKGTTPEKSSVVKYSENDDDVTADHFFIGNDRHIARYLLQFASSAQSDVADSTGTADTTGLYLEDFENTDLTLMGQEYGIVLARRVSTGPVDSVKLTLMGGSARDTLLEGESKTYNVKGKTYEVSLSYVDADEAKFVVNGESTNKLQVGETFVLSDKSEIGVSEVLYQAYAGGVHSATFFVGAQKTVLQDDLVTDGIHDHNLKIGSEDIDGAYVIITGSNDNTTFSLSTIEINMTADDNFYVGAGQKLSEVIAAAGSEEEVLMGGAFDIEYKGLADVASHDIKLQTSSSKKYTLTLYDGDGNAVALPVAYAEGDSYNMSIGAESGEQARADQHRLIMTEGTAGVDTTNPWMGDNIYKDDYFVVTTGDDVAGSAKSYLLQYKGSDRQTKTSPKIKFKNVGSGETLEYSVSTVSAGATATVATVKLGGNSYIVQNASSTLSDDFRIDVDLDGGGSVSTTTVNFVDYFGTRWATIYNLTMGPKGDNAGAPNATHPDWAQWTMSAPNANDYDNILPANIKVNLTAATDQEVRAALAGVTLITPDGESEVGYAYTTMGAFVKFAEPASDPDELTITFPEEQRLPQLFITSGATTTATSTSGNLVAVQVVDATKLASEIADVKAQNLIVVGGPCVNDVAASLLGNPADCTQGFTPGKARVKLFEHANGNVAMLVAGYSGADTRLAGKVIANRAGELFGAEVEIEGTTSSDATISAPGSIQ